MLKLSRGVALLALSALALPPAPAALAQPGHPVVVTTTIGHTAVIPALAIAPDGAWLASGSGTSDVKLWDIPTGRLLRTLRGHSEIVWSLAILPGNRIVSASSDKTIRIWDGASGRTIRTLSGHGEPVNAVAVFPDGKRIASGSWDQSIRVWNAETGASLLMLTGHTDRVNGVLVSADERLIVSGSDDKTIRVWNAATGAPIRTIATPAGVSSIAMSRDGRRIVAGSGDKSVRVWDLASGQLAATMTGHEDAVAKVAVTPDGRIIVSASEDGMARVWDASGAAIHATEKHPASVEGLTLSPDGRIAAIASGYAIKLIDLATRQVLRTLQSDAEPFLALAVSHDGRWASVGGTDNRVNLVDLAAGRLTWSLPGHGVNVRALAFAPDSASVASGSEDGTIKLWQVPTGQLLRTLQNKEPVVGVAFAPGGKLIGSVQFDDKVKLWDPGTGRLVRALSGRKADSLGHLAFSPDGRQVASGNGEQGDNAVRIWDVNGGKLLRSLEGQSSALALSRDGRTLATSGSGRKATLWEVATGRRLRSFEPRAGGAPDPRSSVALSPDGRWLALGTSGGEIALWEAGSGASRPPLTGHLDEVAALTFSADSSRIVSAGWDGTVRIWTSDGGDLLATVAINRAGEWVTITPEGFFAASERGASLLHVVRGFETYAIEQFFQTLYRPDLVFEKLAGDPRGTVRTAAARVDLDKVLASGLAPEVTMVSPQQGSAAGGDVVDATVSLLDRGGGVGRLEWRVNGVTVGIETPRSAPGRGRSLPVTRALQLDEGENEVEVVAYNGGGLVASPPARLRLTSPVPQARAASRLVVLAAGINDYADAQYRLNYAVPDANALVQALVKAGSGLYHDVQVTALRDAEVTRDKLDAAFAKVAAGIRPGDVFVFYVAGHGKTIEGRYYFIPYDFGVEGTNQTGADVARAIVKLGIPQEQWQAWFARVSAKRSVLLFDTCESGTLTGDDAQSRALERAAGSDRLVQATGRTILAASSSDQEANEGYRDHGLFTYNLIEALELADTDRNGVVEVTELAAYVHATVSGLSETVFKAKQVPQVRMTGPNYGLAKPVAFFTAKPGIAIPTRPTHRLPAAADILVQPVPGARRVRKLDALAQVTVIKTEEGWALVAREGRPLGYVAVRELAALP